MLKVTIKVPNFCPWISYVVKECTDKVTLLQCVPRLNSNGVSVLAKIIGSKCDAECLARKLLRIKVVERTSFKHIKDGVLLGIINTRSCFCASTLLPQFNLINVTVNQDEGNLALKWQLLLSDYKELQELISKLNERGLDYTIQEVVKAEELWSLTKRQEEILRAALELGFYDLPKKIGLRELAKLFNISPRAVSEILRRAHKRVVSKVLRMPLQQEHLTD